MKRSAFHKVGQALSLRRTPSPPLKTSGGAASPAQATGLPHCGALFLLVACVAWAYNPPVDTAGPLTVRILEPTIGSYGAGGPVVLNRTEAPFTLTVALENSGAAALSGTVRLAVIDQWRVEPASRPFQVTARGRSRLEFTVTVGEGTFNAHYPIHAFAEFVHDGRRMTAHPVLILQTRLANPPRARLPLEWRAVRVPAQGTMGLWRLPVRRDSARVSRGAGLLTADAAESAPAVQTVTHAGREALRFALGPRPPSMLERAESVAVEYPLLLPNSGPIRFQCDVAGRAAFSLFAGLVSAAEHTSASDEWQRVGADLSRFAGQEITLRLEAEGAAPAYWGEPVIVAGTEPPLKTAVLTPATGMRVTLGRRGILDSTIEFRNKIRLSGFRVQVLGDRLDDRSAAELAEVRQEGNHRIRHRFRSWAGDFDLMSELGVEGFALKVRFWLENEPPPRPWLPVYLEAVSAGPWSAPIRRIYAGAGNVIEKPKPFQAGFDGHRLATSFVGFEFEGGGAIVQGVDVPPDRLEFQDRICTLVAPHAQTLTFIAAPNAWDGAEVWRDINGRKASPGVAALAGRFVFDLWGRMPYREAARQLERAFRYGLTDAAVVWHNWQRWGYDYRLPDIFPPNPEGGTVEDFRELAGKCRKHGVLFAPHDNYIDFYPDAEGFTYDDMAFNRDGTPRRAWYNSGRQAQSYRVRADRLRPFLERNVRLIRDRIAPNAYFIDVWSSMGPYDYWTRDGGFVPRTVTRQVWGESFAWIRELLDGGPQISEAGHDQLIGWLDGAQANHLRVDSRGSGFVWRIDCADAERIPWFDFAYHHLFALHGAGYQDRYAAGLDLREHGMYSDDYIATEVLTGHPAMVSVPFSRDVVRKYWLLHDLMRALAQKRIYDVRFVDGDLHRQHVQWENGEVYVNRGATPWNVSGHTLPQYGFYARAGGVESAIEQGAEWSISPSAVYVLPRGGKTTVGGITTTGGVRLVGDLLIPLPGSDSFTVEVKASSMEAIGEDGAVLRRISGGVVKVEPGVFAYRLR